MHPLLFAKEYINKVEFNCCSCSMYEYGRNCNHNRKSACVQTKKLLNKILDEKIIEQGLDYRKE